jgi:hypothetical protein
MRFTIREYGTNSVTVDFADGSWAIVPLDDSVLNVKGALASHISQWGPKPAASWIGNPVIAAGTEVDTEASEYQTTSVEQAVTWEDARRNLYPSLEEQADAAYWARNGNTSLQDDIDAKIANVKTVVPKTWETRSRAEYVAWLQTIE